MWSFHTHKGIYLGQIAIGSNLHIGRTYKQSKLDLGITNVKVSRKQLYLTIEFNHISCRVDGMNPITVFKKSGDNDEDSEIQQVTMKVKHRKYIHGESFILEHNEMLEFKSFKTNEAATKIVVCRSGLPSFFKFSYIYDKSKFDQDNGIKPKLIDVSPRKLRRISSALGQIIRKDDEDEEDEPERVSIIDRLGTLFSYETAVNDPEFSRVGGSRVGHQYQVDLTNLHNRPRLEPIKTPEQISESPDEYKEIIKSLSTAFRVQHRRVKSFTPCYIKGISLFYPKNMITVWGDAEKKAFLNSIYDLPKAFELLKVDINKKLRRPVDNELTRRDCNEYYYMHFKKTEQYKAWKHSFEDKNSLNAGANMALFLKAIFNGNDKENLKDSLFDDASAEREDTINKKRKRNRKQAGDKNKKGRRVNELIRLADSGLVKPGKNVLYINYQGKRVESDLTKDGAITFENRRFESASAWSYFVKKRLNPKVRSDNGWSSVQYDGKSLSYYRDLYDPQLKTSLNQKSSNKPASKLYIPECYAEFEPNLELVSVKAVNSLFSWLNNKFDLVVFPQKDQGFNLRTSDNKYHGRLSPSADSSFIVVSSEGKTFSNVYSWFKSKSEVNLVFFDIEVLTFLNETKEPSYSSIKKLYYMWATKINKADVAKKEKLKQQLEGKRATNSRLRLIKIDVNEDVPVELEDGSPSETWSKYDRYCICRNRCVESSEDDWYLQCSKNTSYCHGWIHAKCFGLVITKDQSEHMEDFVCPLCSLDSVEYIWCHKRPGFPVISNAAKKNKEELYFIDFNDNVSCAGNKEEESEKAVSTLRRKRIVYLPSTRIVSKRISDCGLVCWEPGEIIEKVGDSCFKYKVKYFRLRHESFVIDIENNPEHMLERDWLKSKCYRNQNICWKLTAVT